MVLEDDPSWPNFLNKLDSDPETAMKEFYDFVWSQMRSSPPRPLRFVDRNSRQDAVSDFIYHCISDNFRVLRKYVNTGRRFAGWAHLVATNYLISWIRREQNSNFSFLGLYNDAGEELPATSSSTRPSEESRQEWRDLCELVQRLLATIGEKCRLRLALAAEEYEIKEIVTALRLAKDKNKQVSDEVRECRRKLIKLLEQHGVMLSDFLRN